MPPHIIVIGAGIVGAAAAWALARNGARVTVFEQSLPAAFRPDRFGRDRANSPAATSARHGPRPRLGQHRDRE